MIFDSIDAARELLNLDAGIEHIAIRHHERSLVVMERDGQVIRLVGCGPMVVPGLPAGNQSRASQQWLFRLIEKQVAIPIFHLESAVRFMGMYTFHSFCKKLTRTGFAYYEFRMHRTKSLPMNMPRRRYGNPNLLPSRVGDEIEEVD
jgi:hypothetical protein